MIVIRSAVRLLPCRRKSNQEKELPRLAERSR